MAKLTTEELIEQFKELTLIELSEFVKAFEETFDVTAAAPAAVAVAAAPGAAGGEAAAEEKDEFDVILEAAGDKKIQVIKEVRALTSLGLKEAKELVDGAPKAVLEGANKEAAEKAKEQLEGAGATITLKGVSPRCLTRPECRRRLGRPSITGSRPPPGGRDPVACQGVWEERRGGGLARAGRRPLSGLTMPRDSGHAEGTGGAVCATVVGIARTRWESAWSP